jgi:hypothetical protein
VTKKPYIERPEGDGTNDHKIAKAAWEAHCQRENSVIMNIIGSMMRSQLTCPDCDKVSVFYEYQQTMQLAIPRSTTKIVKVIFFPQFSNLTTQPMNSKTQMNSSKDDTSRTKDDDLSLYIESKKALKPISFGVKLDRLHSATEIKHKVTGFLQDYHWSSTENKTQKILHDGGKKSSGQGSKLYMISNVHVLELGGSDVKSLDISKYPDIASKLLSSVDTGKRTDMR